MKVILVLATMLANVGFSDENGACFIEIFCRSKVEKECYEVAKPLCEVMLERSLAKIERQVGEKCVGWFYYSKELRCDK